MRVQSGGGAGGRVAVALHGGRGAPRGAGRRAPRGHTVGDVVGVVSAHNGGEEGDRRAHDAAASEALLRCGDHGGQDLIGSDERQARIRGLPRDQRHRALPRRARPQRATPQPRADRREREEPAAARTLAMAVSISSPRAARVRCESSPLCTRGRGRAHRHHFGSDAEREGGREGERERGTEGGRGGGRDSGYTPTQQSRERPADGPRPQGRSLHPLHSLDPVSASSPFS